MKSTEAISKEPVQSSAQSSNSEQKERRAGGNINRLAVEDEAIHGWYRFVLSFPPHLVRNYIERFAIRADQMVLDPFCGTGTTIVECKKLGQASVGIEAHPLAYFASHVKLDWSPDPDGLIEHVSRVARHAQAELEANDIIDNPALLSYNLQKKHKNLRKLPVDTHKLLLTDSISPLPLHKSLVLLDHIKRNSDARYLNHELLALAKSLVSTSSNLHFGPEVGVGSIKEDAPVIAPWLDNIRAMADDLRRVKNKETFARVFHADSRRALKVIEPNSIDAVISSPPYPNEKDYTRTTRLETVLLGLAQNKEELQAIKRNLMRSNTRNVYKGDDDDQWVSQYSEIQRLAESIEARRLELNKTSGFERLYAKVTKLYFGGLARHLAELRRVLRPGARLAYVVGDQASYLQIMIRTGQLLADIAQSMGYELDSIELFRTRLSTTTREQLREEVVILRWPG